MRLVTIRRAAGGDARRLRIERIQEGFGRGSWGVIEDSTDMLVLPLHASEEAAAEHLESLKTRSERRHP